MNFKRYVEASDTWIDSHYIKKTDTDTITTLPAIIYPLAQTATLGLKGNTTQNGTPTPDSPVMPQGTGERTTNLCGGLIYGIGLNAQTGTQTTGDARATSNYITVDFSLNPNYCVSGIPYTFYVAAYNSSNVFLGRTPETTSTKYLTASSFTSGTPQGSGSIAYIRISTYGAAVTSETVSQMKVMFNTGSTAKPFEPHGYKIPISSANTTTPVYLGEVQSTRRIKKLVLTEDETIVPYDPTYNRFAIIIQDSLIVGVRLSPAICSHYQVISDGRSITSVPNNAIYSDSVNGRWFIKTTDITTVADFKSYLAQQYAAGTPVCVWYVLATPTTGIVNEPIRKIGDYADTVSGITIPTIVGANSFDVLTTLKPSEVTVNYKGWHPVADVHERESGAWT